MRIARWLKYNAQSFRHESKSGYNPIGDYQPFFAFVIAETGRWLFWNGIRSVFLCIAIAGTLRNLGRKTYIVIETREGKQLKFGSMLTEERRKFVAGALRRMLPV
jgi:hypothetical protein